MSAEKAAIRQDVLARRAAAHDPSLALAACDRLIAFLQPHLGRPAAGYMAIRSEIDPHPAMTVLAASGPVGVPVIEAPGRPLRFHAWSPGCEMVAGPFGAAIPAAGEELRPEVLIVPLVAFDRSGARLGYGGGYYDRTIQALRARGPVLAVGLAYAEQEVPRLPQEPTDQGLDAIVTPGETLRPGAGR